MTRKLSEKCIDFIDDAHIEKTIADTREDSGRVRDILAKSMEKQALSVQETAALLNAEKPELVEEVFDCARRLKRDVYGNRIVIFAPLYIGNYCTNDCSYCAFRRSLRTTVRKTLNHEELVSQIEALEDTGHKRLILVFGEHPDYTPEFIAQTVRTAYSVKKGKGEIRRVNINAAPLNIEGYRVVKEAGIGTYQIFQETYHHDAYRKYHPANTHKGDYLYRLDGLSRAFEGGCDDVGLGALFGLYNWKFEVLGLITHALHLQDRYGVGPHTVSFPRLRPAHGISIGTEHLVSDYDFKRLVAILRLAVPYTGLILTARETPRIRREVMDFGVSQIDAGTRIELEGYTKKEDGQELRKEQFEIGDVRPMDEILLELIGSGNIPSFCTSCYRLGRTGEHFMEYAIPGFIEKFCTPNALLTLTEYLEDYASSETKEAGEELINSEIEKISDPKVKDKVRDKINRIRNSDERDMYF